MIVALCFAAAAAACWAFVALDLGRRLIEHAKASEERRAVNDHAAQLLDLGKRLARLETAERQTVDALRGRRP